MGTVFEKNKSLIEKFYSLETIKEFIEYINNVNDNEEALN